MPRGAILPFRITVKMAGWRGRSPARIEALGKMPPSQGGQRRRDSRLLRRRTMMPTGGSRGKPGVCSLIGQAHGAAEAGRRQGREGGTRSAGARLPGRGQCARDQPSWMAGGGVALGGRRAGLSHRLGHSGRWQGALFQPSGLRRRPENSNWLLKRPQVGGVRRGGGLLIEIFCHIIIFMA